MKVNFQIISPAIKFSSQNNNSQNNIESSNTLKNLSNIYYIPFGCAELNFENKLESLTNIHCPSCGTKMLSKEEFYYILEDSKQIKDPKEFLDFLNTKKEYISKFNIHFLDEFETLSEQLDGDELPDIIETAKILKKGEINNLISQQTDYIKNILEDYSDFDKQLLLSFAKEINKMKNNDDTTDFAKTYSDLIYTHIYKMESDKKYELKNKLKYPFMNTYNKLMLYNLPDEYNNEYIAYYITKNLLRGSVSKSTNIIEVEEDNANFNKILLCKNCEKYHKHSISKIIYPDEKHLTNYKQFISDISEKSLQGEFEEKYMYPVWLNGLLKKISNGALDIKGTETSSKLKQVGFKKNKEIDFNIANYDGIPCACCGRPTISHERKLEIVNKIADAKDKYEILQILKDNKDIIRPKYIPIINKYESILQENPNATEQEIFLQLRDFAKQRLNNKLRENIDYIKNGMFIRYYSSETNDKLREFIDIINKKYLSENPEEFNFATYANLVEETINDMAKSKKSDVKKHLKYEIKSRYGVYLRLKPLQKTIDKYDSPLKVVAQELIRQSVATKDHFIAKNLKGSDQKSNLVLMCKDCNTMKGTSAVYDWLRREPQIANNFQKQFDYISEKIKSGEIDPKEIDYLKELQTNIYYKTKGKIDISFNYEL